MAKKAATPGDRQDPHKNISLAIRNVLKGMPDAKASQIVDEVKRQYGHAISTNRVYMVKTKLSMGPGGRKKRRKAGAAAKAAGSPANGNAGAALSSTSQWVEAIKQAKKLLHAAGSVANAKALVDAVAS
jgi:hypothetical protein